MVVWVEGKWHHMAMEDLEILMIPMQALLLGHQTFGSLCYMWYTPFLSLLSFHAQMEV
jgi:short subunit fatty acids transporter